MSRSELWTLKQWTHCSRSGTTAVLLHFKREYLVLCGDEGGAAIREGSEPTCITKLLAEILSEQSTVFIEADDSLPLRVEEGE